MTNLKHKAQEEGYRDLRVRCSKCFHYFIDQYGHSLCRLSGYFSQPTSTCGWELPAERILTEDPETSEGGFSPQIPIELEKRESSTEITSEEKNSSQGTEQVRHLWIWIFGNRDTVKVTSSPTLMDDESSELCRKAYGCEWKQRIDATERVFPNSVGRMVRIQPDIPRSDTELDKLLRIWEL